MTSIFLDCARSSCIRVYLCLWRLSLSLSLTRCSQGVVRSRTVQRRQQGQCALRSSQGLVPCGREDCRGCVRRQRYAQKFSPLLQWSSSISTSCFVDCSFVPRKLAKEHGICLCLCLSLFTTQVHNCGSRHLADCQRWCKCCPFVIEIVALRSMNFVMALLAGSKLVNNGVATTMHEFSTWSGCLFLCASWKWLCCAR